MKVTTHIYDDSFVYSKNHKFLNFFYKRTYIFLDNIPFELISVYVNLPCQGLHLYIHWLCLCCFQVEVEAKL